MFCKYFIIFISARRQGCVPSQQQVLHERFGGGGEGAVGEGGVGTYEHKLNLGPLMPEGFPALSHPEVITTTTKGAVLHF